MGFNVHTAALISFPTGISELVYSWTIFQGEVRWRASNRNGQRSERILLGACFGKLL